MARLLSVSLGSVLVTSGESEATTWAHVGDVPVRTTVDAMTDEQVTLVLASNANASLGWIRGAEGLRVSVPRRHESGVVDAPLATIAGNHAEAALAYGALMCKCSFSNLPLTVAGSVEVGYGPTCAKKWGLPRQPKGTPGVQAVA